MRRGVWGEIKIISSSDLCRCFFGTRLLFVSFGHCLCEEGGQTTEWGEGLGGGYVQNKTRATGHVCTDRLVMGVLWCDEHSEAHSVCVKCLEGEQSLYENPYSSCIYCCS